MKAPDQAIVAQCFKESAFDECAGKGKHSAQGLMQVQPNAIKQVYAVRLKAKLGKTPSDIQKAAAFKEAKAAYDNDELYKGATNIQIGTEYLQYWLDKSNGDITKAYAGYRGPEEPTYYNKIKITADKMDADPNSIKPLLEMKDLK